MKKFLSVLLALLIFTGMFNLIVFAKEKTFTVGGIKDTVLYNYFYQTGNDAETTKKSNVACVGCSRKNASGNQFISTFSIPVDSVVADDGFGLVVTEANLVLQFKQDMTAESAKMGVYAIDDYQVWPTYSILDTMTPISIFETDEKLVKNKVISLDVTDYVRDCIENGQNYIDFATGMFKKGENEFYESELNFWATSNSSNPKLIIKTEILNVINTSTDSTFTVGKHSESAPSTGDNDDSYLVDDSTKVIFNIYSRQEQYRNLVLEGYGYGTGELKVTINGEAVGQCYFETVDLKKSSLGFVELKEGINTFVVEGTVGSENYLKSLSLMTNRAPVINSIALSEVKPLVNQTVTVTVDATDEDDGLSKVVAISNDIEKEMTMKDGVYTADFVFDELGKSDIYVVAYDTFDLTSEDSCTVTCVDTKVENLAITKENISDTQVMVSGKMSVFLSSVNDKTVNIIIAVYDENNRMISWNRKESVVLANSFDGTNLYVETVFSPEGADWHAELMLWDNLVKKNSITNVYKD